MSKNTNTTNLPTTARIVRYLSSRKTPATIDQIVRAVPAKESTVRRQISYLASRNEITRTSVTSAGRQRVAYTS